MKCFDLKSTSGSWFSSGGSQFWQQNAPAKLAGFDGGIGCICGKLFRPSTSTFESICRPGHFSRDSQRVKHRAAFSDMVTRHIKLQKKYTQDRNCQIMSYFLECQNELSFAFTMLEEAQYMQNQRCIIGWVYLQNLVDSFKQRVTCLHT